VDIAASLYFDSDSSNPLSQKGNPHNLRVASISPWWPSDSNNKTSSRGYPELFRRIKKRKNINQHTLRNYACALCEKKKKG